MVSSMVGKHPLYYEAILQLRDVAEKINSFALAEIQKAKVPIIKIVELRNGADIYLADSNFARAVGKRLQQSFGGKTVVTASLFGIKKGKRVYRVTVLFRGVPFRKGDKVIYAGEEYLIKSLIKDIFLQSTKTGKKIHVNWKEMKKVKKVD